MDSVLRRFGLKKGDAREGKQVPKDLFGFNQSAEYGFPYKAKAIAYHSQLSLLAIGTGTGFLRIYGAPGVQLSAVHKDKDEVKAMEIFFFGQVNVITLCDGNSLHLWEISTKDDRSFLEEIRSLSLENRLSAVTSTCIHPETHRLLLGTDKGHIYMVDMKSFRLLDQVLFQENIIHNAPEDFRRSPGAVESIVCHPFTPDKLLIGYSRGLIVLWDLKQNKMEQMYNAGQELECLVFHRNGSEFISTHANGSYITWKVSETNHTKEQMTTPYGPFPCKAINKMEWKTTESGEVMMIFSGGMPRASYGDHHTVTVMQGDKHVTFDFTSKVIDFFLICASDMVKPSKQTASGVDSPKCLLVLVEEELIAIDLESDGWPLFNPPYMATVHSTAITCAMHVTDATGSFWKKIVDAGRMQCSGYSSRPWPIHGGVDFHKDVGARDILITGHEDASVRFWDVSTADFVLLYKLNTSILFSISSAHDEVSELDQDEEWPPFRKVGTYDPFSDDPRIAIQKMAVGVQSETLVLGGTAGQVIVLCLGMQECQLDIRRVDVNIVSERDSFVWKGHAALTTKKNVKVPPGFQPVGLIQIHPPAASTALAFQPDWHLVAAGTSHGLVIVDYKQMVAVAHRCTLSLSDNSGVGDSTMSRRKSFKKSLRESFRRLRSRRSERHRKPEIKEETKMQPITSPGSRGINGAGSPSRHGRTHIGTFDVELAKPVERQIEARPTEDVAGSIIRTLYFADTFLTSAQVHTPSLWAGTNAGYIYIYQLTVPSKDRRSSQSIQCLLVKEIHLKHRAPVISICVVDHSFIPFVAPTEVQPKQSIPEPDVLSGNHSVIICSEEQLKVFSLPNLGAKEKYKLTATEGSKVRKAVYAYFHSPSIPNHVECDLVCMTNIGEVQIFSFPHLRRLFVTECIQKENIIGIGSSALTRLGEVFYLATPSEFHRISVSMSVVVQPVCMIGAGESEEVKRNRNSPDKKTSPLARVPVPRVIGDIPVEDDVTFHTASPTDDSVTSGDTTEDSVRIHVSEDPGSPSALSNSTVFTRGSATSTFNTVSRTSHNETTAMTHTTSTPHQGISSSIHGNRS